MKKLGMVIVTAASIFAMTSGMAAVATADATAMGSKSKIVKVYPESSWVNAYQTDPKRLQLILNYLEKHGKNTYGRIKIASVEVNTPTGTSTKTVTKKTCDYYAVPQVDKKFISIKTDSSFGGCKKAIVRGKVPVKADGTANASLNLAALLQLIKDQKNNSFEQYGVTIVNQ